MPYKDKTKQREYQQAYQPQYRKDHKTYFQEYQKRYAPANRKRIREYNRIYHKTYTRKRTRQPSQSDKRRTQWRKQFIESIKLHYRCQNPKCESPHTLPSYCYDFHHVSNHDKCFNIGSGNAGYKRLVAEINKCTVLCANCHRLETWGDLDATEFQKCDVPCIDTPEHQRFLATVSQ